MKHCTLLGFAALLAVAALAESCDASAAKRNAHLRIALTIEDACSIVTHAAPADLDEARHVTVKCGSATTPHRVTLDARTAMGEPLPVEKFAGQRNETHTAHSARGSDDAQYVPIVTVTIGF
jgi:hypothetical protein